MLELVIKLPLNVKGARAGHQGSSGKSWCLVCMGACGVDEMLWRSRGVRTGMVNSSRRRWDDEEV